MTVSLAVLPADAVATPASDARQAPPRGFVLHVDLGPEAFSASIEDVLTAADTLRELVHEWLPQARTRTAVTAAAPAATTAARRGVRPATPGRRLTSVRPQAADPRTGAAPAVPGRSTATLRATLAALPDVPEVRVDLHGREVTAGGRPLRLTTKEFELFAYLVQARGRVVTRDELHRTVWRDAGLPAGSRTVDVHVRRLRAVAELGGLVTTVHGTGYRVSPRPHVLVIG